MIINQNLHNPVPLHTSKDLWYSKARHAEGVVNYYQAMPFRIVPTFQLTSSDFPTAVQRSALINISVINQVQSTITPYAGTLTGPLTEDSCVLSGQVTNASQALPLSVNLQINYSATTGRYTISSVGFGSIGVIIQVLGVPTFVAMQFTKAQLQAGLSGEYTFYQFTTRTAVLTRLGPIDMAYSGSSTAAYTMRIRKLDGTLVDTISSSAVFTLVPSEHRTNKIRSFTQIGGNTVTATAAAIGPHYVELTIDGTTLYSEPFVWVDSLADYVLIRYRRTSPIITADNYIAFVDASDNAVYAFMYLPTTQLAPPFSFDATVEEIDGYKFVQKLVSYRSEHFEFFCTSYFVEAIRVLWHCNIRTLSQRPEPVKAIDFMEIPEINWDNDTHYCSASLTFNTDTVMQTNGNVEQDLNEAISQHQAFDNSFNNSYN